VDVLDSAAVLSMHLAFFHVVTLLAIDIRKSNFLGIETNGLHDFGCSRRNVIGVIPIGDDPVFELSLLILLTEFIGDSKQSIIHIVDLCVCYVLAVDKLLV
jgi:hypothetical protein